MDQSIRVQLAAWSTEAVAREGVGVCPSLWADRHVDVIHGVSHEAVNQGSGQEGTTQ